MINTIYANAYKEVLIVIKNLTKDDYEKIPKEYIKFMENNCNHEYEFEYNTSKPFEEQELLEETKLILFGLFEKYGATDIQQTKIKSFKMNYNNRLEEQKREQYNPDEIFKKKQNEPIIEENKLIEYKKQTWYQKIFAKILKIFMRN